MSHGWLAILTGPKNSGKTTLVRTMASTLSRTLHEVPVNNATDTTDVLGSFEETDMGYRVAGAVRVVLGILDNVSCSDIGPQLPLVSDYATSLQDVSHKASQATLTGIVDVPSHVLDALSSLPEPYQGRCLEARTEVQ
ncbi:hypothetical protein VTO73DRAFT_2020 [Trametes versicolor]